MDGNCFLQRHSQSHFPILTFDPLGVSNYFRNPCCFIPFQPNKTEISILVAEFGTREMATHGDLQSLHPAPCSSGYAPLGGKYKHYNYLTYRPILNLQRNTCPTLSRHADPRGRHAGQISFIPITSIHEHTRKYPRLITKYRSIILSHNCGQSLSVGYRPIGHQNTSRSIA
jgi:hypothetical protein